MATATQDASIPKEEAGGFDASSGRSRTDR